jgi:hypothetical protein
VQNLVVEDGGDAEARLLDEPLLERVGEACGLARVFALALSRDLPDAVLEHEPRLLGREVAAVGRGAGTRPDLRALLPDADELRHLLFERHAAEQVRHAPLDGQARVLIVGRPALPPRRARRCGDECEEREQESRQKAELFHRLFMVVDGKRVTCHLTWPRSGSDRSA